jgi:hypothetical protein
MARAPRLATIISAAPRAVWWASVDMSGDAA